MQNQPNAGRDESASSESIWGSAAGSSRKPEPPKKKRGLWKKLLIGGAILVVVLIVGVVGVGPSIAGSMVPGIIHAQAGKAIRGGVTVESTSFSWGGPQVIGPVTLSDPSGKTVAKVKVEATSGIWGLATGYFAGTLDAGQVVLTGKADIVKDADGQTNLQKALTPKDGGGTKPEGGKGSAGGGSGESKGVEIKIGDLPPIKAAFLVKDLDITYTEPAVGGGAAVVYKLDGLNVDGAVNIDRQRGIDGKVRLGTKMGTESSQGVVDLDASIKMPPGAGGVIRPIDGTFDTKVTIASAPVAVIDALAMQGGKLLAGLGETADVQLTLVGDIKKADASLVAKTPKASADLSFAINDFVVTSAKPGSIAARGETLKALVPAIEKSLNEQKIVTLAAVPDVKVALNNLKITLPKDGGAPKDLRGTSFDLSIDTTGMEGTVSLDAAAGGTNANGGAAAAPKPFTVAPLSARVSSVDLGQSVKVLAGTTATVEGRPAGELKVDLTASNLLDSSGAVAAGQIALAGTAALTDVSTAIAQPFVQAMKIDLPQDVGPELDLKIVADAKPAAGGGLPSTTLDADVQSQHVRVTANLELADGVLKTRGEGVTAAVATAGSIASRFVEPGTGFSLDRRGVMNVRVTTMSVPLPKEGQKLDLGKLSADFTAALGDLSLRPVDANGTAGPGGPIGVQSLKLTGNLTPGGTPKVVADGRFDHAGQAFTLASDIALTDLFKVVNGVTEIDAKGVRPQGVIELKDLPTALAGVLPRAPEKPAEPGKPVSKPLDLVALLRGAVGPTATVRVESTPRGQALDFVTKVTAQNLAVDLSAGLEDKALDLRRATIVSTIAPGTVDAIMDIVAPDLADRPRLSRTTRATIAVEPIRVPLTESIFAGFKPDIANAPDATLTVTLPERTLVEGLALKNEDGSRRDLGSVGVEGFSIVAKFPPAALAGTAAQWSKRATATMQGKILSGPDEILLDLAGNATADLSGRADAAKSPLDRLTATAKVDRVAVRALERLAAMDPGFISGAIGDTASATMNVNLVAPAGGGDLAKSDVALDATLDTPRLRIPDPVKLRMTSDRIAIDSPMKVQWNVDHQWANRLLAGKSTGSASSAPATTLTGPVTLNAVVQRLVIGRGEGVGPLKPGVFALAATADVPKVEMAAADGSRVTLDATTFDVQAKPGANGDVIDVNLKIAGANVAKQGAAPAAAQNMTLAVSLSNLADPAGNVNAETATIDARGDLPVIPVPLLDVFANQDGLLTAALGPVAEASIRANQFSKRGGTLDLRAKSTRASAVITGAMQGEIFATTQPLNVTISEVSPELTAKLLKGVPLIGSVEKTPQDRPATITGTGVRVPLNNDLRQLAGEFNVDPGEAKFGAGGDFAKILNALNQKAAGKAGQRLEPLKVKVAEGVATYERWKLPLGEFEVTTEGKVDLVARTIDVITWLPIGALSDEAAGAFKIGGGGLGSLLGGKKEDDQKLAAATAVPFRTRGTFERNSTTPDLELFAKEVVKQLAPEDAIKEGLKKGIEDLLKKR